jgi:hypothetical protein
VNGSQVITNITQKQTYTITCTGAGGSATASATVTVSGTTSGYDIIIVGGQSNAVGAGLGPFTDSYANPTIDARIMQLGRIGDQNLTVIPATWVQDSITYDALQHWVIPAQRKTMGFAIPFARRYIADGHLAANRKVLIVPTAYGGTSILKWLGEISTPTTTPNALYDDMRDRVRTALALPGNNRIVAFLWHQGESDIKFTLDGKNGMTASVYKQKFTTLVNKIRTNFPSNPKFPIVAGDYVPAWRDTGGSEKATIVAAFEKINRDVLSADGKGGVVSSAGLIANYPAYTTAETQVVHFSAASQVSLGDRYYKKWKGLQDGNSPFVSISADPTSVTSGGSSTLTWSSTNATSCTASGGWSGAKGVNGSQVITNITQKQTYTITCTGAGGSASDTVTVSVSKDLKACVDSYVRKIAPYWINDDYSPYWAKDDPTVAISADQATLSTLYPQPQKTASPSGFFADNVNYFKEWGCKSDIGITSIRKLNIATLEKTSSGTYISYHDPRLWKDSLFLSPDEFSSGFPIVYFTQGLRDTPWKYHASSTSESLFNLRKAFFNAPDNHWYIGEQQNDYSDNLGISSQDGTRGDYVLNDNAYSGCNSYVSRNCLLDGWGPTANKPGSQSRIPGVLETPVDAGSAGKSYKLYGYGPDGLSSIAVGRCTHGNPTLFDYTGPKHGPRQMMVSIWYFNEPSATKKLLGCPNTTSTFSKDGIIPNGNYIYMYEGAAKGWQMKRRVVYPGVWSSKSGNPEAINYIHHTANPYKFITGGHLMDPIQVVSLFDDTNDTATVQTALVCTAPVSKGEPSGYTKAFIFHATMPSAGQYGGKAFGLYENSNGSEKTWADDIYLATVADISGSGAESKLFARADISKIFRDLVGRNPTAQENIDMANADAAKIREAMVASPMVTKEIHTYYQALYNSNPNTDTINAYLQMLRNGNSMNIVFRDMAAKKCAAD